MLCFRFSKYFCQCTSRNWIGGLGCRGVQLVFQKVHSRIHRGNKYRELPERPNLEVFMCVRALLFPRASAFVSFPQDPPEKFATIFRKEKKRKMDDEVGHLHKKVKQQATNTSVFGRGRQDSFSHGKTKK